VLYGGLELVRQNHELRHAKANVLAELSTVKLLSRDFDSALRLASNGMRIDQALLTDAANKSPAVATLAAAISRADWLFALGGHDAGVNSATFSPDGSRIVTASDDKTARIWDAATGKEVAVLRGHDARVNSAAFGPGGSRVVTASWDQTARIWDTRLETMPAKDLLVEACTRLRGVAELTRDEMRLASYPDSMPEIDVCP
jgi:WD40 repeat protein